MKRFISSSIIIAYIVIQYGCSSSTQGELTGVLGRGKYFEPEPHGMMYIPPGSFTMGPSEQDMVWGQTAMSKTFSVNAFWMDQTEITNNEYRQFVHWVIDSIKRRTLAMAGVDGFLLEGDQYEELPEEKRPLNWRTGLIPEEMKTKRRH